MSLSLRSPSASGVEDSRVCECRPVDKANRKLPRVAAYFTIFHILLKASAARIDTDCGGCATVRTGYMRRGFGGPIAYREFFIQIVVQSFTATDRNTCGASSRKSVRSLVSRCYYLF